MPLSLQLESVTKRFSRTPVFAPISFEVAEGDIVALTGINGSGKSTLLKIIAKVTSPSKGSCNWKNDSKELDTRALQKIIGYVAPYIELYNELTAIEHIQFIAELKGYSIQHEEAIHELLYFGLDEAVATSDRVVKNYSSGMQQRVRLAATFISDPDILLLDEPSSNLDEEGIRILFRRVQESAKKGAMVIIATNDEREKNLASKEISLLPYRRNPN